MCNTIVVVALTRTLNESEGLFGIIGSILQ